MASINSKPNNNEERRRNMFHRSCQDLLVNGLNVSKIAKILNKSYKHTKLICDRIKSENKDL